MPGPSRVKLVPLTPVTGSLKVAVTLVLTPTFVAAAAGVRLETVGGVVSGGGGPPAPGRRATSAPTLTPVLAEVAVRGPEAPVAAWAQSAAAAVILNWLVEGTAWSKRSVWPADGVTLVRTAVAKKPTSIRSGPLVVDPTGR